MEYVLGIIGILATLAAGAWAAFRAGGSEQRARTVEALAAAAAREKRRLEEADAAIERERITAVERIREATNERKADAAVDIDAAEAALRKRTDEPWEP